MKRLFIGLFVAAAFFGVGVNIHFAPEMGGAPAPAATITAPAATPTAVATAVGAPSPDLGLSAGYPNSWYNAFNLNTVSTAVTIVNLNTAVQSGYCEVSVTAASAFADTMAVTQASTVANLYNVANITGWITASGVYDFPYNGNSMFQVENEIATSGSPLVSVNCHGGTVVFNALGGSGLLK
jgi:hypothetical protein